MIQVPIWQCSNYKLNIWFENFSKADMMAGSDAMHSQYLLRTWEVRSGAHGAHSAQSKSGTMHML
jgi:hypothetical protein